MSYSGRMSKAPLQVVPCPPDRRAEALALVLRDIAPSQRREIGGVLLDGEPAVADAIGSDAADGLFIAVRCDRLCGAAWGLRQPGNTAILWPPRLVPGEDDQQAAAQLARAAVAALDAAGVMMSQVLLRARNAGETPTIEAVGFRYLADLMYLACEADGFPSQPPAAGDLQFEPFEESQRGRLVSLIERTYEGTLDCPALEGGRRMDDVIDGYRATGSFRPSNWYFVRELGGSGLVNQDLGVLLLAAHPGPCHWELVYMGLTPEARGRGWGRKIARQAQWLARCADAERLVLAVDAANLPALAAYRDTGFVAWDQRAVFVRFLP